MGERIRTLIVDDEPLAREGVRLLLAADAEVEVVGECGSGREAVAAIRRLRPELMFLDVHMPEMSGFDTLAALPAEITPYVVFVTAYDGYALRAFEVHALDYLLKPFDDERFYDALGRAKRHLRLAKVSSLSERLLSLLESVERPAPYLERLPIKDAGRVVFLDLDEVEWIEAADYYVQLHTRNKAYLHRETMASLEARLDPRRFLRIHRSAIVNQRFVRELRPKGQRDLVCVLASGATLKVARSHRDKIQLLR